MMDIPLLLLASFAIGVAVTAPIGPINLMVIRTALKQGFLAGAWVGLGSVLGDGIFASIAAFGVTTLYSFFEGFSFWLQLAGGLFMLGYGLIILIFSPALGQKDRPETPDRVTGNIAPIITTLALTLTNPATMLGFIGLFGALSGLVDYTSSYYRSALVVLAVMAGSLTWICSLSALITWLRQNLSEKAVGMINKVTAASLMCFGAFVLFSLFLG